MRELENYLVAVRPLVEFLRAKGAVVQPAQASEAINESVESLKPIALEKRVLKSLCRPVYPDRKRLGKKDVPLQARVDAELRQMAEQVQKTQESLQGVIARDQTEIELRWEAARNQLVPGDELLDGVCAKFGRRYFKERDAGVLAGLFNSDEIAPEIAAILRSVGAP